MKKYIPSEVEKSVQAKWEKTFKPVSLADSKRKYYLLVEFPYSSGDLHIGHWFAFGVTDIFARYKKMQGYNVFFPVGFDSFGLPAENAAIKRNLHPRDWTLKNVATMRKQFGLMGALHDWNHEVVTCLPQYYKWNQWIFLKMLEKGIAYRGHKLSNWCPTDQTVLADEQVVNGKCDRCGADIVQKEVGQWFLKITEYADKLLWKGDEKIDWPKSVRVGQNAWIGKSEGMEIKFKVESSKLKVESDIRVYTVFPETIYGVTYMVLAPEHKLVPELTTQDQKKEVDEYIKRAQKKSQLERISLDKEKTGVFSGSFCINPVNGAKVPIWIADYVIAGYGTGAVMGVPGSDHRDFEFAKKYKLPIVKVIGSFADDQSEIKTAKDVLEEGYLVASGKFSGLKTPAPAKEKLKDFLSENNWGERKTQFHLHDWSISRQRYWGTPIPIINCPKCGAVPVPYDQLPVELPYEGVDYAPTGKPPLASAEKWMKVACPNCGGDATREPETMDGFFDNSWYFFRYLRDVGAKEEDLPWDPELVKAWMPVDIYFGGAEHTLGHTLYSRFFTKFFSDLGLVDFDEYAKMRVNHGVILGPDGSRMSKSRGNVVNPDEEVKKYGADAIRTYLAFIGPYDLVAPWDPGGIGGVYHFLERVWKLFEAVGFDLGSVTPQATENLSDEDLLIMNQSIKKVGEDIEAIKFNTAVSTLMSWLNYLSGKAHRGKESEGESVSLIEYQTFLKLLAPFAPHITEELWQTIRNKLKVESGKWKVSSKKLSILNSQLSILH